MGGAYTTAGRGAQLGPRPGTGKLLPAGDPCAPPERRTPFRGRATSRANPTEQVNKTMTKRIVTVIGGTGLQGGGVVDALLAGDEFRVRVVTRHPSGDDAQDLQSRGVEVVEGDILYPGSLIPAFEGAYGAFVVTNYWEPAQMTREAELGTAAVNAARKAGIKHLIWSTLPDVERITGGRLKVPHFTGKAHVDLAVRSAGFERHSFVMAPLYYQNFLGTMSPQALPNGGRGWLLPIDPAARVVHAGDVREVGIAVAAAFEAGDKLKDGTILGVCGGTYSFNEIVRTLNAQGHNLQAVRVSPEAYDKLYKGAREMREMFQYIAEHTYFGPDAGRYVAAANALVPGGFTGFAQWAKQNMPVNGPVLTGKADRVEAPFMHR